MRISIFLKCINRFTNSGIALILALLNIVIKCCYFKMLKTLPFKGTDPRIGKPAQRPICWIPND